MSVKNSRTTTSGLEWNSMLGLLHRLKQDKQHRDYLLICVGCFFGLRAKDLLALKWRDLYNEDQVIDDFVIIESKTGKKRRITINQTVKESLNHVRNELTRLGKFSQTDYLFANRWGGKISISYINRRLHKIFEIYNIKVQNGSTHTLRKSFGKRVFDMNDRSESSLIYLSEIFGHSSIATTKRYIGITQQVIADVYLKL
jgi:integrase